MPSNSPAPAPASSAPAPKAPALKAPAPSSGLAGSFKVTGGPRGSIIDMRGRSAAPAPMQKLSSAYVFGLMLGRRVHAAQH